jgi:ferritin
MTDLSEKMTKALNDQIQAELYSWYIYLAMASYFDRLNLTGFAHWMQVQAAEEMEHGMKIFQYLPERNASANLQTLDAPPAEWDSPEAAVQAVLDHEKHMTERIYKLVALADTENDYASRLFLDWYVTEQVEEEASVRSILDKMEMLSKAPNGLYLVDRELARRQS